MPDDEHFTAGHSTAGAAAPETLDGFWSDPEVREQVDALLQGALVEDCARDDRATAALFGRDPCARAIARITARADGVVCGTAGAWRVFELLDPQAECRFRRRDGHRVGAGDPVLVVAGGVAALLSGERTALNLLGHLSGIASRTAAWVASGPGIELLDTRKTLPGYRRLQKHAVRAGGGSNHRADLAAFPMIKENHRELYRALRGPELTVEVELAEILAATRRASPGTPVQVEVEDYASFRAALAAGWDLILIDNRSPDEIRSWIDRVRAERIVPEVGGEKGIAARLEASGGITQESLPDYARCGVTRVSVGAITHSAPALDLSMAISWPDDAAVDAERGH